MDLDTKKVNRQVYFLQVGAYDTEDSSGNNNSWIYDRAPNGYCFELLSAQVSTAKTGVFNNGALGFFDGHEYTHWNLWPGVESREYLGRAVFDNYQNISELNFHDWECKEFSMAVRSFSEENAFKVCIILYYHLKKMTPDETKMYAVLQPKSEHYKKGGPTTLTEGEETV